MFTVSSSCCFISCILCVFVVKAKKHCKNQPQRDDTEKKCEPSERNNMNCSRQDWKRRTHRITRTTAMAMENLSSTMRRRLCWCEVNIKWNSISKVNWMKNVYWFLWLSAYDARSIRVKVEKFPKIFTRGNFLWSSKLVIEGLLHDEGRNCGRREKFLLVCGFLCRIMCLINNNRLLSIRVAGWKADRVNEKEEWEVKIIVKQANN